MKLLLTSSGITNKSIERALLHLLGRPFDQANLTFIPTAANVEKGDKTWMVNDMNNLRLLGFAALDIMDISAVSKDIWYPSLESADILVFGGGNVNYLLEWTKKSGLAECLLKLLETKIYVGISAGSMVTAKNISLSSAGLLYYEKTDGFNNLEGLGLVDFEIRPHLNSEWFPKVTFEYLEKIAVVGGKSFYAIDDSTAVQVIDKKMEVITEGEWKRFN